MYKVYFHPIAQTLSSILDGNFQCVDIVHADRINKDIFNMLLPQ